MATSAEIDRALDSILLIYILKKCAPVYGRTKIQKTTFRVEFKLREQGLVGPHFRFSRYNNGPFSAQLWDVYDRLVGLGLLHRYGSELSEDGDLLLELAIPELSKLNPKTFEIMDGELAYCAPKSGESLMQETYMLETAPDDWPTQRMPIEKIPLGVNIIVPPPGGVNISDELLTILVEQLSLTPEQLKDAQTRMPILENRVCENLSKALSERPLNE